MATVVSGVQYSGIWTMQQVNAAIAAGTWPTPYIPAGGLWTFGRNFSGQLGIGTSGAGTNKSSPTQVGSLATWSAIAQGNNWSVALKSDKTLWSWGDNSQGQLGLGNTTSYSSPVQVGSLTNWLQISAGYYAVGAIKTNGTLWTWGFGLSGGLGLGDTTSRSSPTQVGSLSNWSYVYMGTLYFGLSIKTDGTLWSWGRNGSGQLGLGNTTYYSSPKQVGALTTWSSINAAGASVLALKTDGTLWSWGANASGQLGLGNTTSYSSPKQVGSLTTWNTLGGAAGGSSFAIKANGTLWSWGYNGNGELGLNNTTTYSSPTQVGALTNWSAVGGGTNSIAAIKTDGTLWTWGFNAYGQLGLGNTTGYSSPKQVGALTTWIIIDKVGIGTHMSAIKTS